MKICQADNCNFNVFSNHYCSRHQQLRQDEKYLQKKSGVKPKKWIAPVSEKRLEELKKYKKVRAEYLETHPTCEAKLKGCTHVATQIHHKSGRIGKLLTDKSHFLAVDSNCHIFIENHPHIAKELGLSSERFTLTTQL